MKKAVYALLFFMLMSNFVGCRVIKDDPQVDIEADEIYSENMHERFCEYFEDKISEDNLRAGINRMYKNVLVNVGECNIKEKYKVPKEGWYKVKVFSRFQPSKIIFK